MLEIITTKDGSHSLRNIDMNESYHSIGGAISESEYVYIQMGLAYLSKKTPNKIRIFEVGFGTGLNCFLTYNFAQKYKIHIEYDTIDVIKLDKTIWKKLNYSKMLESEFSNIYDKIHLSEWNKKYEFDEKFEFQKKLISLEEFESESVYDLIYFDAFGAKKQESIWSKSNLIKIRKMMVVGGVFVTYACTSNLKKILTELGFEVQTPPGALTKREMIRAIKL